MTTTVGGIRSALEQAYPKALAASWDTGIGLTCGDPAAPVTAVLLAVDVDDVTVAEAVGTGAQMLVTHHPMLFRPVQSVAADTPKGRLVHLLITGGVAHLAAHTNADKAPRGVNVALAEVLDLQQHRPLLPDQDSADTGSGRIGTLPTPMTVRDFAALVAERLPTTVTGARWAGDGDREVRTVALCGGSGGSYAEAAAEAGADVYLTSDLSHHEAGEFVAEPGRPALVEVAHWAAEWTWLPLAAQVLQEAFPELRIEVSTLRTDPWGGRAAPLT